MFVAAETLNAVFHLRFATMLRAFPLADSSQTHTKNTQNYALEPNDRASAGNIELTKVRTGHDQPHQQQKLCTSVAHKRPNNKKNALNPHSMKSNC